MESKNYTTLIFGVGNIVMGDDGIGPEVINELQRRDCLPAGVQAVDVDTGVREHLFDYLLTEEGRPDRIIIIDAVDMPGHNPGDIFELTPEEIPDNKVHNFTLHQFANVNLLSELQQNTDMSITFLAVQVESFPNEIAPGLSPALSAAVPVACDKILEIVSEKS